MSLHDALVGATLGSRSHFRRLHLLVPDPHLIWKSLEKLLVPTLSQTCCLHCSLGRSANVVGAAPPLRNQRLTTVLENGDTADGVSKYLADPSLIPPPSWGLLSCHVVERKCMVVGVVVVLKRWLIRRSGDVSQACAVNAVGRRLRRTREDCLGIIEDQATDASYGRLIYRVSLACQILQVTGTSETLGRINKVWTGVGVQFLQGIGVTPFYAA